MPYRIEIAPAASDEAPRLLDWQLHGSVGQARLDGPNHRAVDVSHAPIVRPHRYSRNMHTNTWTDLVGSVVAERYRLETLLYSGRHQAEFQASPILSGEAAEPISIVLIEMDPAEIEQELPRITAAMQLRHPNVLAILDRGSCSLPDACLLYIVAEATEGTLEQAQANGPLPAADARELLEDLLDGLAYIHSEGLVCRSLSPGTVVRAGGRWKIGDLGELHAATRFGPNAASGSTVPPEASNGFVLPAWDIWSLGVTLQDALTSNDSMTALPAPFGAIVRGCFEPDPERRLTLQDIRDLLHPKTLAAAALAVPTETEVPPPAPAEREVAVTLVAAQAPDSAELPSAAPPALAISRRTPFVAAAVLLLVCIIWLSALLRPRKKAPSPVAQTPASVLPATSSASAKVAPTRRPSPFSNRGPEQAAPPASVPPPAAPVLVTAPVETSRTPVVPLPAADRSAGEPAPPSLTHHWEIGQADYLSDSMEGQVTASGERFSGDAMNAAHRGFPLGTRLRVTNLENDRSAIVRINDRGAFRRGYIISVTRRVAEQLGFVSAGSARVKIEVLP